MNIKSLSIDICIATYKRAALLQRLLQAIESQEDIELFKIHIVIVDNDIKKSAFSTVDNFRETSRFTCSYEVEPQQNIALARNRAVKNSSSDYIIFIDDDEEPIPRWVRNIIDCAQNYNADVVFGPVVPILPDNTPTWIVDAKLFSRPINESGAHMDIGETGNTLVRKNVLSDYRGPFDEEYGLTGGSDSKLFNSMHNDGKKMVWCDSAEVYEKIEASRMSLKYILLRAFRVGQCFARVKHQYRNWHNKIGWFLYRLSLLIIAILLTVILLPLGKRYNVKPMIKIFTNLGQLSTLTNYNYQEYTSQSYIDK